MQTKYPLSEHTFPLTYSHATQIHSLALLTDPFSFLRGPWKLGRGAGKVNAFNLKYCHLDNYSVLLKHQQKKLTKLKNQEWNVDSGNRKYNFNGSMKLEVNYIYLLYQILTWDRREKKTVENR